jgi:hypothetical protein
MAKRTGVTIAEAAKHKARSEERKTDVSNHIQRLGGKTRDDVTGDLVRGPGSPLGRRKGPTEQGRGR